MSVSGMNHFTIVTDRLDETVRFYESLLGLTPGYRPPMAFDGAWMYCGSQPVLHIMARETLPAERAGVLDHMAFTASGLPDVLATLEARSLPYRLVRQQQTRVWQLFFHDPNGARVELDFEADSDKAFEPAH